MFEIQHLVCPNLELHWREMTSTIISVLFLEKVIVSWYAAELLTSTSILTHWIFKRYVLSGCASIKSKTSTAVWCHFLDCTKMPSVLPIIAFAGSGKTSTPWKRQMMAQWTWSHRGPLKGSQGLSEFMDPHWELLSQRNYCKYKLGNLGQECS